jgi:hypothetical protein
MARAQGQKGRNKKREFFPKLANGYEGEGEQEAKFQEKNAQENDDVHFGPWV